MTAVPTPLVPESLLGGRDGVVVPSNTASPDDNPQVDSATGAFYGTGSSRNREARAKDGRWQSLTFEQLVVAVAEQRGTAHHGVGGPALPTDDNELMRCRNLVRRGWLRFVTDNPNWKWMQQVCELDIEDGVEDYTMPWYFYGKFYGPITYTSTGPRRVVELVSEDTILEMRSHVTTHEGDPTHAAVVNTSGQAGISQSNDRVYKLTVYPTPSQDRVLKLPINARPDMLWGLDDKHFAGPQFNRVVEFACRAEAEIEMIRQSGPMDALYRDALRSAIMLDAESGSRMVGSLNENDTAGHRTYGDLTSTWNGD